MSETTTDYSSIVNHSLVPPAGTYRIDPVHTFVEFGTQHLVVGRVRGRFRSVRGTVTVGQGDTPLAVDIEIDPASVSTMTEPRDDDLRSPNYFDVVRFPLMTFRSTSLAPMPGGSWLMTGDLTIKDVTRPVELVVHYGGSTNDPFGNLRLGFTASGCVTRSDFGLTQELFKESGNLLVQCNVAIEIGAEVVRPL